ncbi:hypothetical protein [Mycobacterium sp. AZCC_0083]|uniref:hypothetical protein n=1 Tax=Mycobacterium sp. AZCC_0083 TaxID=2735882 RepID=UPI001614E93D|nr:hypothetical protein [Mycobacterium sp. AZCC_0083]MBB5162481.1 hypothetical protein [Mycobacterium sp. AZCC_0083]
MATEFWRWWKVTADGVLASPIGAFRWETADYRAACPHDSKPKNCWCGVYAFTSADDCRRHISATKMFAPTLLDSSRFAGVILGRVVLSDDAFLAKAGPPQSASVEWIASACRITHLYADGDLSDQLAVRYGVPVQPRASTGSSVA